MTQESGTNSQLRHHQRSLQKQLIDMAKRAAAQDEALSPAKRVPTLQSSIVEPDISVGSLALAGQAKYDTSLNFDVGYTATKGSHLIVGCKVCHWHPPAGSISRTRVVVHEDRSYFFQVLLREKNSGKLQSVDEFLNICEMMANSKSEFKFCPGIDPAVYQSVYFSKIRYDLKQVRCMEYPFERIDSCGCLLYHKLSKNSSVIERGLDCVQCSSCKRLVSDLNQRIKSAVSSPDKVKRQQPSSHCPLKYMSPTSQQKRKENTQRERAKDRTQLQKYSHTELTLDDEQHDELTKLMEAIDKSGEEEVEKIMKEADRYVIVIRINYQFLYYNYMYSCGAGDAVREIWEMDKKKMKDDFTQDQQDNC